MSGSGMFKEVTLYKYIYLMTMPANSLSVTNEKHPLHYKNITSQMSYFITQERQLGNYRDKIIMIYSHQISS